MVIIGEHKFHALARVYEALDTTAGCCAWRHVEGLRRSPGTGR